MIWGFSHYFWKHPYTLPETNSSHLPSRSGNPIVFQPSIFRCEVMLDSLRVNTPYIECLGPQNSKSRLQPGKKNVLNAPTKILCQRNNTGIKPQWCRRNKTWGEYNIVWPQLHKANKTFKKQSETNNKRISSSWKKPHRSYILNFGFLYK